MLQNTTIALWFSAAYGSIHIPVAKSDNTWKMPEKAKGIFESMSFRLH